MGGWLRSFLIVFSDWGCVFLKLYSLRFNMFCLVLTDMKFEKLNNTFGVCTMYQNCSFGIKHVIWKVGIKELPKKERNVFEYSVRKICWYLGVTTFTCNWQ